MQGPSERPRLLRPPRLRTLEGDGLAGARHASWLELFYDLVFVVIVAELAHKLEGRVSWPGVAAFAALFVPVWWCWVGTTFYADRFDTDDLVHRLATAVQMVAVGVMALNVHDGLGSSSTGFAAGYVAVRIVLVVLYLGARASEPATRSLTSYYSAGFAIAAAFWLASIFVLAPVRFVLWGVGLAVDFGTPLSSRHLQVRAPLDASHLPERFGLFTIIVLGEAVVSVVQGIAGQEWRVASATVAALGFTVAFALWWIYFDNVEESAIRRLRTAGQIWLYAHLPLVMSIVALGVGVEHAILTNRGALPDAERWLLCGAMALGMTAMGAVHLASLTTTAALRCEVKARYRFGGAVAALAVGVVGAGWGPLPVMLSLAAIGTLQVVSDVLGRDDLAHHAGQADRALPDGAADLDETAFDRPR